MVDNRTGDEKEDNFRTVLRSYSLKSSDLLQWHFEEILTKIQKRISLRHTCRNTWAIEVKTVIHPDIFLPLYVAFENFQPKLGLHIEEEWYKSRKELKSVTFKFDLLGVLVYHLANICNHTVDIPKKFTRTFKCGSYGNVVVNHEKPATIMHSYSNKTLKFRANYIVRNEFGVLLSY